MTNYNPFSLYNKTILVTGASSGIGRAIAVECSKMGANVIITARNEIRLNETLDLMSNNENHKMLIADLNSEDETVKLSEALPKLDGIVHCAGLTIPKPFHFYSKENIDDVMDVNFNAPVLLTNLLIKQKKVLKSGSIVFISSISGVFVSAVAGSIYSASKGAINGLAKGLAIELAAKGIRVNSVNPGVVETNIFSSGVVSDEQLNEDRKKYPLKRHGRPEEVAYAVVYLLSDASSWVTGSNLLIDGGYTLL
ncbi:MAG: SDR family oxidoreductase [Neisseria sp.]|nr:SDR family oxidoreductase [Neisseria sp.]MDO5687274.1 SDR family oxidoreductase [Neisseria sp.]